MTLGSLYLIPVPLAEGAEKASNTLLHTDIINSIQEYIVENEKTARRFLKEAGLKTPQNQLVLHDYGKHTREKLDYNTLFQAIYAGKDVGLMSEAGCPAVADPGAEVVAEAHRRNIRVVPMVGPSSILLALMGSGFSGQKFAFHGYLPIDKSERTKKIKSLEQHSLHEKQTQLFIETPFRNESLFAELLKSCKPTTMLSISCNLTSPEEIVLTMPISKWQHKTIALHKKPCIFLLYCPS